MLSSSIHSTSPVARSNASANMRCLAVTFSAATATVIPRPIAAGVLGMARTTAPPHTSAIPAMVAPAMIETTRVDAPVKDSTSRRLRGTICGFIAEHESRDAAEILGVGI